MKSIFIIFCLLLSSCTDVFVKSVQFDLSGFYECPLPKKTQFGQSSYRQAITHRKIDGVETIVIRHLTTPKSLVGPFTHMVYVVDNKWRYQPYMGDDHKIMPVKVKFHSEANRVHYLYRYPKFDGSQTTAGGAFWRNKNGHLVSRVNKGKPSVCKQVIM